MLREVRLFALGHLESTVMDIVWERGESSVHDVIRGLGRPLAYTTVMTTLDRLYKKGLLARRKLERAFVYSPSLTRRDWGCQQADLLISTLVDGVSQHDEAILDELERRIRLKRKELDERRNG